MQAQKLGRKMILELGRTAHKKKRPRPKKKMKSLKKRRKFQHLLRLLPQDRVELYLCRNDSKMMRLGLLLQLKAVMKSA